MRTDPHPARPTTKPPPHFHRCLLQPIFVGKYAAHSSVCLTPFLISRHRRRLRRRCLRHRLYVYTFISVGSHSQSHTHTQWTKQHIHTVCGLLSKNSITTRNERHDNTKALAIASEMEEDTPASPQTFCCARCGTSIGVYTMRTN